MVKKDMLNSELIIKVNGVNTRKDASKIRKELGNIEYVKSVKVSLKSKKVTLIHKKTINVLEIEKLINSLGYKYIGVE